MKKKIKIYGGSRPGKHHKTWADRRRNSRRHQRNRKRK